MIDQLDDFISRNPRLVALTGAGVSAASGIPTYRNDEGQWQRSDPIQHQAFINETSQRRRYWARSMVGWHYVAESRPNPAHHGLAALEQLGHLPLLVTQNVDRLHQRAGHQRVIDLHGRLDRVVCRLCAKAEDRAALQTRLIQLNTGFAPGGEIRPDGDAEIDENMIREFNIPGCQWCEGVLMPDVVFFGGSVPRERVRSVDDAIRQADALMAVGSSLSVYSGFRFCKLAHELGKPILIINQGWTRADELADLKITGDCGRIVPGLSDRLGGNFQ